MAFVLIKDVWFYLREEFGKKQLVLLQTVSYGARLSIPTNPPTPTVRPPRHRNIPCQKDKQEEKRVNQFPFKMKTSLYVLLRESWQPAGSAISAVVKY